MTELTDSQLERYSRHILLDEIDLAGQMRLLHLHALVIGCGGLGSACIPFLASSGVGYLTLVDADVIELSNLQRQTTYRTHDVGLAKVHSMAQAIHALNPDIQVQAVQEYVDETRLLTLVQSVDVVVDCTDHFSIRQAINRVCVRMNIPLVSGSAVRFEGQLAVYDARAIDSPCYACVFEPDVDVGDGASCASLGIFAPVVGVIGAIQASLTLQILLHMPVATGQLQTYNALRNEWHSFKLTRNPHCTVCGENNKSPN
ncbi:MAG: molybdopterin biosynthesis protein MoeB [Burkholderiaceae bacterium]|nr:molybdopterin biosynthesis protein MoeB [Burkholderiaceae bacterium]